MTSISSLFGVSSEAILTGDGFTIPEMPILEEGMAKEVVAQYTALSRLLPEPEKGRITVVDLNAFEGKSLTLDEAVKALRGTKGTNAEVWVVVRSR